MTIRLADAPSGASISTAHSLTKSKLLITIAIASRNSAIIFSNEKNHSFDLSEKHP